MRRALLLALALPGCAPASVPVAPAASAPPVAVSAVATPDPALVRKFAPLPPLPPDPTNPVADDEWAARLGQRLFYDTGYSRDNSTSCASCHQPARAFADGRPTAHALGDGRRNTPALGLAAYMHWQGWGGRADSIGAQSLAALENPLEMGMDRVKAARRLLMTEAPTYQAVFGALPDTSGWPADGRDYDRLGQPTRTSIEGVSRNLGHLLGAYVRKLVPGPSAFDRYAQGDATAVSGEVVTGFGVFTGKAGCAECHGGPLFTDGRFHNIGVPQARTEPDHGRQDDLAKLRLDPFVGAAPLPSADPADDARFRTPSLRDVSRTAPYWHGGTFASLEEAVDFDLAGGGLALGKHFPGTQDPKLKAVALTSAERQALLAFLRSLEMTPVPAPWGGPDGEPQATPWPVTSRP